MKKSTAAAFVAILGAVGVAGWWQFVREPAVPEQAGWNMGPVPVLAAPVTVAEAVETIRAVGNTEANAAIIVASEIEGRLRSLTAQENAFVTAGTVIAELDDALYQAQLSQAQAELAVAKANYERASKLGDRGFGTGRERDEALAAMRTAEAAVATAQTLINKTKLTAPFPGKLGLWKVSPGAYLDTGTAITNLENTQVIKVDFRVPERVLTRVAIGQSIRLTLDAVPGEEFTGEIFAIDPRIDAAGRSLLIRARVPNDAERLRPGLFARVELIVDRRPNAVFVEERALVSQGSDRYVFKVVDGKAQFVKVTLGVREKGLVEVREGLAAGDVVVLDGQMKLGPDAPVQLIDMPPVAGQAADATPNGG